MTSAISLTFELSCIAYLSSTSLKSISILSRSFPILFWNKRTSIIWNTITAWWTTSEPILERHILQRAFCCSRLETVLSPLTSHRVFKLWDVCALRNFVGTILANLVQDAFVVWYHNHFCLWAAATTSTWSVWLCSWDVSAVSYNLYIRCL